MIKNRSRAGFIGGSDTAFVMGSWETKTFAHWWREKQGFECRTLRTDAVLAGTFLEHRILKALNIPGLKMDEQKITGCLRVNLDGSTDDTIYEVKTYRLDKGFKVSSAYWMQVQVEMYAFNIHTAYLAAYGLQAEDYLNYYREIEKERLSLVPVQYDPSWIKDEYLPRLNYLSACLESGKFPKKEDLMQ